MRNRPVEPTDSQRKSLVRKALFLEYLTIVWNVIEGIVSVTIGALSGSLSMVAFGLESGVEVFSSAVVLWHMKGERDGKRQLALRMIGTALVGIAAFIAFQTISSLFGGRRATPGIPGMLAMAAVTIVMFSVGSVKRHIGRRLNDRVLVAESGVTLLDAGLSGSILVGLVLSYAFGWWWTDQALALLVAGNALREGVGSLRSEVEGV